MYRKIIAVFAAAAFLLGNQNVKADMAQVSYKHQINVEVYKRSNVTITPKGLYTLKKLDTNENILLKPGASLVFSNSNKNVKFGAFNLSSSSGFELKEMSGISKLVTFSTTTYAKREASSSSETRVTYYNGEAAEYIKTYVNGLGETWFIIKAKNGNILAVKQNQYVNLVNVPNPSLFIVEQTGNVFRGSAKFNIDGQVVNQLHIEDYLKGVVPNEMPASWHIEALKAQAVAARSYAYVKNSRTVLTKTVSSQKYEGYLTEHSNTNAAVDATKGKVVTYNGKVIETFFHSTSGGKTANVGDVWKSDQKSFPYLVSVEDPYEKSPYSTWENAFSSGTILSKFGLSSNTVLYDISAQKTGANGEVSEITINTSLGQYTKSGTEQTIRSLLGIKSNWFDISASKEYQIQTRSDKISQFGVKGQTVQLANGTTSISSNEVQIKLQNSILNKSSDPATIVLKGKGWGHRIGMSQYGAKGFAEHDWTYDKILTHYFPGTTIGNLN
jgi:stage II sporulation protein D